MSAVLVFATSFAFSENQTPSAEKPKEKTDMSAKTEPRRANRLIHSTSPYLLQHARNPVDWFEWGQEAFEKARKEDKLIFLSIGYSACHWCHVMEHETFESEEIAAILNEHFVCIKVDREERPDVDEIYMAYTQALTGRGGWPMSVWLRPDGQPFYAGTYYPSDRFRTIIEALVKGWKEKRAEVDITADDTKNLFWSNYLSLPEASDFPVPVSTLDNIARHLAGGFDRTHGGTLDGGSNKFPPSMAMEFLLRVHRRTGDPELLQVVEITLKHMARGGIYDQIGGGICRYSTDREWLVPHFEKMLYDQALVSSIYLDAYQVTKNREYANVAADIFQYVLTDLASPEGGFYSSRDADSDGKEGAFYIWTVQQIHEALGEEEGKLFCAYFDVSHTGNWFEQLGHAPPGPKNILHVSKSKDDFAKVHGLTVADLEKKLTAWREKMIVVRAQRTPPGLDDKILTAWNGLMIASLAKGARVLNEPKYAAAASRAAECILKHLRKDGRLLRTFRRGVARYPGFLEDYAYFIEGLLNLYEATFERKWLDEALALNDALLRYFADESGGFFFYASDGEELVARTKPSHDSAVPSGNSVQTMNLLRLAALFNRKEFRNRAESYFRALTQLVMKQPGAYDRQLCALDFFHDRVTESAIIGDASALETGALLRTVYDRYLPNKVVVHASDAQQESDIPLLKNRGRKDGKSTAYVCENYVCRLPVTEPSELAALLDEKQPATAAKTE